MGGLVSDKGRYRIVMVEIRKHKCGLILVPLDVSIQMRMIYASLKRSRYGQKAGAATDPSGISKEWGL